MKPGGKPPAGINAPRQPAKPGKPDKPVKRPKGAEGVEAGDSIYVRHSKRGAVAVRVTATGKHGFTARCDKDQPHQIPWDAYLGHKARMRHKVELVEQGADGALVRDATGRQRFVAGLELPEPETPKDEAATLATDDPILGGMDRLKKSEAPMIPPDTRILFLKAQVANRPGLALQQVTDRAGHQTKRWKHTGPEEKHEPQRAPMKHGDVVQFRHKDVQGGGKIVASGADGVTVQDDAGTPHQVRHEHLIHPEDAQAAADKGEHPVPAAGSGGDGATPPDPAQAGGGGGGGTTPPEQFSAAGHYAQHNDDKATPESVLADFPPDTAQKVAAAKAKLDGVEQTIDMHRKDGQWTPERMKLHETIIGHFITPELLTAAKPAEGEKPTFTLLGGRGGSGKSWFKGQVYDPAKAVCLDADEIKGMLPEYQGWNAAQVHEESGELFDHITDLAKGLGLNIVHDATMKTPKKAVALVNQFKGDGYRVEAHYMHLPRQEAAKRAIGRFLNGGEKGRFVPPEVILGNTQNEAGFDEVKGLADAWSFRDNSGAKKGASGPVLISEKADENHTRQSGRDGRQDPAAEPGNGGAEAHSGGDGGQGQANQGSLRKAHTGEETPPRPRSGGLIVFPRKPRA